MEDEFPPMPASESQWQAHWAFYVLTVDQRNNAWRAIEQRDAEIERLRKRLSLSLPVKLGGRAV